MTIEQRLYNLEARVKKLQKEIAIIKGEKKTWVKAKMIGELTGWNKEGMRRARVYGYVKFKKVNGSFFYLLESVNQIFLKSRDFSS